MKYIKRLITKRQVNGATQYTYLIADTTHYGEHTATAIQKFKKGELVRTWYKEEYDKTVVGKLCQRCLKPVKSLPHPAHEFCAVKRT